MIGMASSLHSVSGSIAENLFIGDLFGAEKAGYLFSPYQQVRTRGWISTDC